MATATEMKQLHITAYASKKNLSRDATDVECAFGFDESVVMLTFLELGSHAV
jgi:hypothetical protein